MKRLPYVLLLWFTPALAQGQMGKPTDSEVANAIAVGTQVKKFRGYSTEEYTGRRRIGMSLGTGVARDGDFGFIVEAQGPLGRIETKAAEAAKKYMRYTIDSVSESDRAPVLLVRATPRAPTVVNGRLESAPPATHIVLLAYDKKGAIIGEAVQPLTTERFPVEWTNLMGGSRQGQGIAATFDMEKLPAGDFYIAVITSGKEARFGVWMVDRPLLR